MPSIVSGSWPGASTCSSIHFTFTSGGVEINLGQCALVYIDLAVDKVSQSREEQATMSHYVLELLEVHIAPNASPWSVEGRLSDASLERQCPPPSEPIRTERSLTILVGVESPIFGSEGHRARGMLLLMPPSRCRALRTNHCYRRSRAGSAQWVTHSHAPITYSHLAVALGSIAALGSSGSPTGDSGEGAHMAAGLPITVIESFLLPQWEPTGWAEVRETIRECALKHSSCRAFRLQDEPNSRHVLLMWPGPNPSFVRELS
jgi:hypothetical protein